MNDCFMWYHRFIVYILVLLAAFAFLHVGTLADGGIAVSHVPAPRSGTGQCVTNILLNPLRLIAINSISPPWVWMQAFVPQYKNATGWWSPVWWMWGQEGCYTCAWTAAAQVEVIFNACSRWGNTSYEEPPRDGQPSVDGTSAHSETPPTHSPDLYCLEHCRHGRSGDGDMIRCCMCFRWHHEQCVADGSIRQDTPWWLRPSCRSLPDTVRVMSKTIQSLQQSMNNMLASNNALVNSVKLSCDRSKHLWSSNTNVPNLLIGASTIRDIACTGHSAHYIISRAGQKLVTS